MITAEQIHKEFYDVSEQASWLNNANSNPIDGDVFTMLTKMRDCQNEFPLHKIIPLNKVIFLCKKYSLMMRRMSDYTGFIPDKNLRIIDAFIEKTADFKIEFTWHMYNYTVFSSRDEAQAYVDKKNSRMIRWGGKASFKREPVGAFYICAPAEDFVTSEDLSEFGKVNDPIVLYRSRNYNNVFVIVSAWGPESTDTAIVNEKNN